jgi:hypothetical protein
MPAHTIFSQTDHLEQRAFCNYFLFSCDPQNEQYRIIIRYNCQQGVLSFTFLF